MKNPEQVARIESLVRIEQAARIAHGALDVAPVAYAVPIDHPLAHAYTEAKLALAKLSSLSESTLKRLKR